MATRRFLQIALASFCMLTALAGTTVAQTNTQLARLQELPSDFHAATTVGDYDLMLSLWADDAVFSNPAVTLVGPTAIADYFASRPDWGRIVSLAPTYKTMLRVHGDIAYFEFECILVDVSGLDPLTTALSTIPPGAQNPAVEIVAHLKASGLAVKAGNRWVFQTFVGSPGPIVP